MLRALVTVCAVLCVVTSAAGPPQKSMEEVRAAMGIDGTAYDPSRYYTIQLTSSNLDEWVGGSEILLVLFADSTDASQTRTLMHFQRVGYETFGTFPVGFVDASTQRELAARYGATQSPRIVLFRDGIAREYAGDRTATSILTFMNTILRDPPVSVVSSKQQKKDFSNEVSVRVLGYFSSTDSQEAAHFIAAAKQFQGEVMFAIVTDSSLAKSLKLKKLNEIAVLRPLQAPAKYDGPIDASEIMSFVHHNRMGLITEMTAFNMYGVWSQFANAGVLAFFDSSRSADKHLALYKSVAKQFAETEKLGFFFVRTGTFADPATRFNVTTFPSFAILTDSMAKSLWYTERKPSAKGLKRFVSDYVSGRTVPTPLSEEAPENEVGPVFTATANTFDKLITDSGTNWLVFYWTSWCEECAEFKDVYSTLATDLASVAPHVSFANFNGESNWLNPAHRVSNFPALRLFTPEGEVPHKFGGEYTRSAVLEFLGQHVDLPDSLK